MSPITARPRATARTVDPAPRPRLVTPQGLLDARRRGLESSTAALPAPAGRTPAPVAALPPELDATRAPPPVRQRQRAGATDRAAAAPLHQVLLPDGTAVDLSRPAVAGRAPSAEADADPLVLVDPTRSVSRTHARLGPTAGGVEVVDLGSANGTVVRHHDGSVQDAPSGLPCTAEPGSTIHLGDVALTVTAAALRPRA